MVILTSLKIINKSTVVTVNTRTQCCIYIYKFENDGFHNEFVNRFPKQASAIVLRFFKLDKLIAMTLFKNSFYPGLGPNSIRNDK